MRSLSLLFLLSLSTASLAADKIVKLNIASVDDQMAFDKTSLDAPAGATVELTLKNNAKSEAMTHNWVLLKKAGIEADIGNAGAAAGEKKNYIPENPNIIAHTVLAKPGKSVKVKFKAPSEAGDYPYICSYPGHYVMMKGVLHVK